MLSRAELYEFHASECVRAAKRTDDPELRERFLRLAREWMLDIANLPLSDAGPAQRMPLGYGGALWNPPHRTGLARCVLLRDNPPWPQGRGRPRSGWFPGPFPCLACDLTFRFTRLD